MTLTTITVELHDRSKKEGVLIFSDDDLEAVKKAYPEKNIHLFIISKGLFFDDYSQHVARECHNLDDAIEELTDMYMYYLEHNPCIDAYYHDAIDKRDKILERVDLTAIYNINKLINTVNDVCNLIDSGNEIAPTYVTVAGWYHGKELVVSDDQLDNYFIYTYTDSKYQYFIGAVID